MSVNDRKVSHFTKNLDSVIADNLILEEETDQKSRDDEYTSHTTNTSAITNLNLKEFRKLIKRG